MPIFRSSIKQVYIGILISISSLFASAFVSSSLLYGQTVTFAGTQTTLPASGLSFPLGVAVDSAGDVFIADYSGQVLELPKTGTGYGPQTTLPFSGLDVTQGVAVDNAGDVFLPDQGHDRVVELPRTETGYGPQTTLPASGLSGPTGVAVDSAGDVFIADYYGQVLELPKTATGYGPQTTLPFSGLYVVQGVAVDSAGEVFAVDLSHKRVVELPRTATGYGPQTTLPASGLSGPVGVAVDSAGDVFITDNHRVVELPKTETGYGPQTTLLFSGLNQPVGVAVDGAGDVFIADTNNNRVVELQTSSVNFGHVNVCAPGQTSPAPCREILALTYYVTSSGTLGIPAVLTGGALDFPFTLAPGSTCTGAVSAGATCTVNVKFKAAFAGERDGVVQITDASGNVLASTLVYGNADHSGFTANSMALNGAASIVGTSLVLTDGGPNEAASAYDPTPVFVQKFTTAFDFQLTKAKGDGFTFTILNVGNLIAIGAHGGGLGYEGLTPSVAIKFDLYNNAGEGINSTGPLSRWRRAHCGSDRPHRHPHRSP